MILNQEILSSKINHYILQKFFLTTYEISKYVSNKVLKIKRYFIKSNVADPEGWFQGLHPPFYDQIKKVVVLSTRLGYEKTKSYSCEDSLRLTTKMWREQEWYQMKITSKIKRIERWIIKGDNIH